MRRLGFEPKSICRIGLRCIRVQLAPVYEAVTQPILGLPRAHPFLGAKRALMRLLGANIGRRVMIYPDVWIVPISSRLVIGDDVDLSRGVMITTSGGVTIGHRALIGYGSKILSTNHTVPPGRGPVFGSGHTAKPIVIGDDTWIGANVVVLPGVTIGEGTIVAAGAVVTKSLPPFVFAAGVPAVQVRERRDEREDVSGTANRRASQ